MKVSGDVLHHPSLPGRRLSRAEMKIALLGVYIADFHCITGNPAQFCLTPRKRLVAQASG